jgi:hypothetical protein
MQNAKCECEQLTAAVFNKLAGPSAPPIHNYDELQNECFDNDELKDWRDIDAALAALPSRVMQGITRLLADWQDKNNHGRRHAFVLAASVAARRGQIEVARDLLLVAGILDIAALLTSGADDCAIGNCESLFDNWKPTERDSGEAHVRCFPMRMESMFSIGRSHSAPAE